MAEFQSVINAEVAKGIPGAFASNNPHISTPVTYLAAAATQIGAFVWVNDEEAETVLSHAPQNGDTLSAVSPVGFAHHTKIYTLDGVAGGGANVVPEGQPVDVMVGGDFYAETTAKAVRGQKVFAKLEDGSIVPGDAGASVDGAVETNFYFAKGAEAGELAIITSTYVAPSVAGTAAPTTPAKTYTAGDGIAIDANGKISVALGDGVELTNDKKLTVPLASANKAGRAKVGTGLDVAADGTVSVHS